MPAQCRAVALLSGQTGSGRPDTGRFRLPNNRGLARTPEPSPYASDMVGMARPRFFLFPLPPVFARFAALRPNPQFFAQVPL